MLQNAITGRSWYSKIRCFQKDIPDERKLLQNRIVLQFATGGEGL